MRGVVERLGEEGLGNRELSFTQEMHSNRAIDEGRVRGEGIVLSWKRFGREVLALVSRREA